MIIHTDGSAYPNPGNGGWGYVRSDGVEKYGSAEDTTNNRMELSAILNALYDLSGGTKVTVYSDSMYCVNGLTKWHEGWKKKGWLKKGSPMPNRDLWLLLDTENNRVNATFKWVKSHNGDLQNERADELANIGRESIAQDVKDDVKEPVQCSQTFSDVAELIIKQGWTNDMLDLLLNEIRNED